MGRHRHAVNVRTDGLAAVLGPLANDRRVRAAALIDVDSGMVLDACGPDAGPAGPDTEARGAAQAEIVSAATALAPGPDDCEVVVHAADRGLHVLRTVADPQGGRVALAVVLADGAGWTLSRLRRRLRAISAYALTAGPSTALRPTAGGWDPNRLLPPAPPAPATPVGPPPAEQTRPLHDLLWVPSSTGTPDGSTVPAIAGIPVEPTGPLLRRRPGSAWTAPPAPVTPGGVGHHETTDEPHVADVVPRQGRPAPPSALPPGLARPAAPPAPAAPAVPAVPAVPAAPAVPAVPAAPAAPAVPAAPAAPAVPAASDPSAVPDAPPVPAASHMPVSDEEPVGPAPGSPPT